MKKFFISIFFLFVLTAFTEAQKTNKKIFKKSISQKHKCKIANKKTKQAQFKDSPKTAAKLLKLLGLITEYGTYTFNETFSYNCQ